MSYKSRSYKEEGFTHILVLVIVLVLGGVLISANVTTTKEFPPVSNSSNVLGEDEEAKQQEEQIDEENKKMEEEFREALKDQQESQKSKDEVQRKNFEPNNSGSPNNVNFKKQTTSSPGIKSKFQTERMKSETEIETLDGQKIKSKVEDDGLTKIEIENKKLKFKYIIKDGQTILKAENEEGDEVELDEDELEKAENEIEEELDKDDIKVSTNSGKPVFSKNKIGALTDFPLSVDSETNQLIVTTPAGQKRVAFLPDQAIENLIKANVINTVDQNIDPNLEGKLGTLDSVAKLELRNDEVVYKVNGSKTHNLFGIIPINVPKTIFVSAQTGDPVAAEQSALGSFVEILSPQ